MIRPETMTDFELYVLARWCYSVGLPLISDSEYTLLHDRIKREFPDNEYVKQSWSSDYCPVSLLRKYNLQQYIYPVVVTDKTESIESLNSLYAVKNEYSDLSTEVTLSYKHDGWNIQASYYNGQLIHVQTRGRTNDAIVIDNFDGMIPRIVPMEGKVTVIMEATVTEKVFQEISKIFGNVSQRGCVATLLANKQYTQALSLHAFKIRANSSVGDDFNVLRRWGFETPMHTKVSSYIDLMQAIEAFSNYKKDYIYPTDGLVVDGVYTKAIRILAWEEPIYKSYVVGYKEEFGPHSCSIAVKIYPIKLQNSTQYVIPATNLARIIGMNLQIGAPIAFRIAASAIADLDESSTILLHKTYAGKWEQLRQEVEGEEALKGVKSI
ncbi:MAG: hypothetical protein LBS29_05030 [Endomicrobium sp.]|nr:hypothetical protein [Endomicrobium sp.]